MPGSKQSLLSSESEQSPVAEAILPALSTADEVSKQVGNLTAFLGDSRFDKHPNINEVRSLAGSIPNDPSMWSQRGRAFLTNTNEAGHFWMVHTGADRYTFSRGAPVSAGRQFTCMVHVLPSKESVHVQGCDLGKDVLVLE